MGTYTNFTKDSPPDSRPMSSPIRMREIEMFAEEGAKRAVPSGNP